MSYNNLSVQVTSTTGTWNGSSFSYSSIALDSGIPDLDQIEVERIFDLTTITTDTSGAAIPAIASNITTVDLRKIYLLAKTNYTLNQTTHAITGFSITSTSKTFTFTGTGALNGKIIYIPPVTNGQQLTVRRKTYSLGAYVTWVAGTRLTSEQLNGQVTQLVKIVQELLYKLDSEFVKKTDFLATDAASLEASSNINMANNYVVGLNPAGTYLTGYAVPMDYVNNMGFRHGVITKDTSAPATAGTDINIAATSTEGRSGIWFDPQDGRLKVWAGNAWVVATAASRGPGVVQLTGTQSISGAKTFLNTVAMDQSATVGSDLTVTNNLTVDTNTLHVNASTNRVGIGITSPTRKLHLHEATASTDNYLSITNNSTGSTATNGLLIGLGTTGAGTIWHYNNQPLVFGTNNTERVRITAAGNVGIKNNNPGVTLAVDVSATGTGFSDGLNVRNTTTASYISIHPQGSTSPVSSWDNGCLIEGVPASTGNTIISAFTNNLVFQTASRTERMRITDDGRLLLGISSILSTNYRLNVKYLGGGSQYGIGFRPDANDTVVAIFENAAGTSVGSISQNASNAYFNTSSDYRLKSNIQPLTNALSKIEKLKPSKYTWLCDLKESEGFIAHELQEVIPYAVTGKKDAIKEDGSIDPQQVDLSKVVPLLTAAIQELKAIVDAQAQRIAVLEGAINA